MTKACRKLTNDQALEIRTLFRDGVQQKELSTRFEVDQTNISSIVTGLSYVDAPWPPSISSGQVRKRLPDFPGYEFDEKGNSYSFHLNKRYGRLMIPRPNHKGYLSITMTNKHKKPFLCRVNRIICTLFHGPPPSLKHQARHLNGCKRDNRAINLAWGTQKENEADKVRHGTISRTTKLTETIVREIRDSKDSSRKLAIKYDVSQPTILDIINRKTWKHVI